jgi:DNA-binding NarL/FixJ family response regulator
MNKLFIIEDFSIVRRGLAAYCLQTGRWELVGEAASLGEAKEKLLALNKLGQDRRPDLILLDLELGEESGLNLLPWLRTLWKRGNGDGAPAEREMPAVLVFSHYDDQSHRKAALHLGADAYLCKSAGDKELEEAMQRAIKHTANGANLQPSSDTANALHADQSVTASLETVLDLLTPRESEVFLLVRQRLSGRAISRELGISQRTVENHLSCIHDKTGLRSGEIRGL